MSARTASTNWNSIQICASIRHCRVRTTCIRTRGASTWTNSQLKSHQRCLLILQLFSAIIFIFSIRFEGGSKKECVRFKWKTSCAKYQSNGNYFNLVIFEFETNILSQEPYCGKKKFFVCLRPNVMSDIQTVDDKQIKYHFVELQDVEHRVATVTRHAAASVIECDVSCTLERHPLDT